jgi:hypothetical protein
MMRFDKWNISGKTFSFICYECSDKSCALQYEHGMDKAMMLRSELCICTLISSQSLINVLYRV